MAALTALKGPADRYLGAFTPFGKVTAIEPRVYSPLCTVEARDGTVGTYTLPFLIAHGTRATHE